MSIYIERDVYMYMCIIIRCRDEACIIAGKDGISMMEP